MSFSLPDLPYAHSALDPHIDTRTMEIHHGKHHQGYVNNLNGAIEGQGLDNKSLEDLIGAIGGLPAGVQNAVRNNGGGHWNHSFFWSVMGANGGGTPGGDLAAAINTTFGSFDEFKTAFVKAGATRFGSGWAWLIVNNAGNLEVCSTPNQDNPLMDVADVKGRPILGVDVWEHAYYLNYQNRRPDYLNAFFNVVNWDVVAENFKDLK
ncbi:MAG: superoxide dismutase [Calditrichaeota bacterium]|nr:MAG: superoxide dismutase [Calditrichota bacterium]MBL1204515.1 superoxide dismutase [Calditrichota bacterium]NOG44344.1 superoxide dismutase [Calditrichota bacterium]